MHGLIRDIRHALRDLRRHPTYGAIVVATLALGIGATSAIFSAVDAVLLEPLPYPDADRLVQVWDASGRFGLTEPEFVALRDQATVLESVAVYVPWHVDLTGVEGNPERLAMAFVSERLLETLRVAPWAGRDFARRDMDPDAERVAILAHGLWARRFGADRGIVGRTVTLNGRAVKVIGILPPGFEFPGTDVAVLAPYRFDPSNPNTSDRGLLTLGRLAPDVTVEEASEALSDWNRGYRERADRLYGSYNETESLVAVPLRDEVVGSAGRALWMLLAAAGFVLLIACANIGGMLLARVEDRVRDLAIRRALGAGRGRLIRQLLTESLVLAVLGGGTGLLLAAWGMDLLVAVAPEGIPRLEEASVDAGVLGFAFAATLVAGTAVGLLPALRLRGEDLETTLRSGGERGGTGRSPIRRSLVVAEIALALVLVGGAGLMTKSLWRLTRSDPGFETRDVMTFQLGVPASRYGDTASLAHFYQELTRSVEALPEVEAVGAVSRLPLAESNPNADFEIAGRPTSEEERRAADYRIVTPGYFEALGIRLVSGRRFTSADAGEAVPVAVIDRTMSRRYWPGEDPVGTRIRIRDDLPWLRVVGVVEAVKSEDLRSDVRPTMYFPHAQMHAVSGLGPTRTMSIVTKTRTSPPVLARRLRRLVAQMDPLLPVTRMRTMGSLVRRSVADARFGTILLGSFAALALLLAVLGVYGILAYLVVRRRRELGVRMALGATGRDLIRLVLGEGAKLGMIGAGIGLVLAFGLVRLLAAQLYEVSPLDPTVLVVVSLLLLGAALGASWVPARRAAALDPMLVLRQE